MDGYFDSVVTMFVGEIIIDPAVQWKRKVGLDWRCSRIFVLKFRILWAALVRIPCSRIICVGWSCPKSHLPLMPLRSAQ